MHLFSRGASIALLFFLVLFLHLLLHLTRRQWSTDSTAIMFGNGTLSPTAYLDRLEAFKRSDDERIALVTAVVNELDELKLKYAEKVDDYNNEVASRRMWQAKVSAKRCSSPRHVC